MPRTAALWWATAASLAAHAALLWTADEAPLQALHEPPQEQHPIRVRLAPPAPGMVPAVVPAVVSAVVPATAPATAAPVLAPEVIAAAAVPPPAHAPTAPALQDAPESSGPPPAPLPMEEGSDGYVLRHALTVPPRPRHEVPLAWPPGWFPSGRLTGVFTLYIDERGWVRRVVPDGPTLPPRLQLAAQDAFAATRFEPGLVGVREVKSLIRVEVEFNDTTPRQPAATVVTDTPL